MNASQIDIREEFSFHNLASSPDLNSSPIDIIDLIEDDNASILPRDFKVPSCLDRGSLFFEVLTAPYRVIDTISAQAESASLSEDREICEDMVQWSVDKLKPQEREEATDDNLPLIYKPHGRWARTAGLSIKHSKTLMPLREGMMCSASIDSGFIGGRELKYISRRWSLDKIAKWEGFHSELALYKSEQYLKPLQGDVVPHLIGVHLLPGSIAVTMELPHQSFWMEASPTMPNVLKERCIAAFEKIHSRGVLHGDPELRHMLIGADGRVTIIDFQLSKAITANESVDLGEATLEEFRLEMRKVKYKLDYQGARKLEEDKINSCQEREARNRAMDRRRIRRANGERAGRITPNEEATDEDKIDPPVNPQEFREQWVEAADATPMRLVVPGQSNTDVEKEICRFITSLEALPRRQSSPGPFSSPISRKRKSSSPIQGKSSLHPAKRSRISKEAVVLDTTTSSITDSTVALPESLLLSPSQSLSLDPPTTVPQHPSPWTLPHTNVHMWYSDQPEEAEVSVASRRPRVMSQTAMEIRAQNIAQCYRAKLPHASLVERGLVKPPSLAASRPRRSIGMGNLVRRQKYARAPVIEAEMKRERYMEMKQLKNAYIATCAGPNAIGAVEQSLGVRIRPGDQWEAFLDMGEPKNVPEGPRILPRSEFDILQRPQRQATVRSGILKRRTDNHLLHGLQSPENRPSPTLDMLFHKSVSSQAIRQPGLPPPRKKARTAHPRHDSSSFALQSSEYSGHAQADLHLKIDSSKVTSLQARLSRGPGVDLMPPSLRVLSSWLESFIPGWGT
ncbi:hypothetical protein BJ138DRAFT_1141937 [Hygrophoropsis aurantiaca]|uniref:Uncharacterized protein n=1 Tax=Hygrophoropsis aurantiaca TaxID=72124 RepID=A0ACB8AQR3_9AGAM|nr:hypothetical protein BJ138DRAFT_1141937 [Hygrophoropsis aurantiaca]